MPRSSLFITGTDTDVGKTVVTAAIAAAIGGDVRALKPVASGVSGEESYDAVLIAGSNHPPLCAARFVAPLSPHRAARMEGRRVDRAGLLAWIHANEGDPTLVEGCGGWEVPLDEDYRVSDLAVDLGWPVLVVVLDRLGCLNHTLLTVNAVRARGLPVAGVVLNGAGDATLEDLRTLLDVDVHPFPWLAKLDARSLAAAGQYWRV